MEGFLQLSTAVNVTVTMTSSTDHVSGKTGLTLTIYASKAAGTPASISPTVTELDSTNAPGVYKLALTTSHTNTLGELLLHITGTGADAADYKWEVATSLPGESVTVGTNNDKTGYSLAADQAVNVTKVNGTTQTARDLGANLDTTVSSRLADSSKPTNWSSLSIDSNGRVDVIKVNGTSQTARDLGASVLLSSGTGTGQISLSSGAVTVGTNNDKTGYTASTVSDKTGYSLTQTFPTNFSLLAIDPSGRIDLGKWIGVAPLSLVQGKVSAVDSLRSNTAQAGSASSITLDSGASATDDFYKGDVISVYSGTGSGGGGRLITAYNGTTKVATVAPNWVTAPDNTSVFIVRVHAGSDVELWGNNAPNALISGRVDSNAQVAADSSGTTTLLGRLTSGRATNLDNLDAAVSSRSTYAGTDTSGTTTLLSRLTSGRATNLDNLDAAISSRMATFTLPANFSSLAIDSSGRIDLGKILGTASAGSAGYVGLDWAHITAPTTAVDLSGTTVKNVDNAIATVTTLTNLPSIPNNWLTAAGIAASALNGKGDWLTSSGYTAPPTAATIATTVWQDLTSGSDFTTASSIGKLFTDDINATVSSRSTYAGADTSGTTTLLSRLTSTRATNLDNLDAAISSRMATFTLPANFSSLAIAGGAVTVGTNNDKTGYSLINAYDPAKIDPMSVTLPGTYTGQQAGNLLWRIGNRPNQ